jgi:hypothetical protein
VFSSDAATFLKRFISDTSAHSHFGARNAFNSRRGPLEMIEKAQLVLSWWIKGELITRRCSLCGQVFLLPEDRNPNEAVVELLAAFDYHVREVHGEAI